MISITISIEFSDILNNYFIFQQVTEYSILSGKLSMKAKLGTVSHALFRLRNTIVKLWLPNLNIFFS